jgi:hypothetical protein
VYDRVARGDIRRLGELRQLMDSSGITPKGQQDRRWERPKPPRPPRYPADWPNPYAHLRVTDEVSTNRDGIRDRCERPERLKAIEQRKRLQRELCFAAPANPPPQTTKREVRAMTHPLLDQALTVEQVTIERLRPDPANPRRITDDELEALTRSLRQWGFVQPVVARREDATVIGGHQRLVAARRLGLTDVPVIWVDLEAEQAKVLGLALNRISGSWDEQLLARLLAELESLGTIDLSGSGFGDDEVKDLLRSLDAREKADRVEAIDLDQRWKMLPAHLGRSPETCGNWASTAWCAATRSMQRPWSGCSTVRPLACCRPIRPTGCRSNPPG